MSLELTAVFRAAPEGGYVAFVEALPGANTRVKPLTSRLDAQSVDGATASRIKVSCTEDLQGPRDREARGVTKRCSGKCEPTLLARTARRTCVVALPFGDGHAM